MIFNFSEFKVRSFFLIPLLFLGLFFVWSNNSLSESGGHLVISQVQISEGDKRTTHDFIEIFNPTISSVNLKGHRLVKRTKLGQKDDLIKSWDRDTLIDPGGYFLWASNNDDLYPASIYADVSTSDTIANDNGIALRKGASDTGEVIDSVAWGNAENSFAENTRFFSNPGASQSLERKMEGNNIVDTNNNANDFVLAPSHPRNSFSPKVLIIGAIESSVNTPVSTPFSTPSPAPVFKEDNPKPTIVPSSSVATPSVIVDIIYSHSIRINEFLPDPQGEDKEGEWIELYNDSEQDAVLKDWVLDDEIGQGSSAYKIPEMVIKAHGYKVFPYKETKITLNNGGGQVNLIFPDGKIAGKVVYSEAETGMSYNFGNNNWYWTNKISPDQINSSELPVQKSDPGVGKTVKKTIEQNITVKESKEQKEDKKEPTILTEVRETTNEINDKDKTSSSISGGDMAFVEKEQVIDQDMENTPAEALASPQEGFDVKSSEVVGSLIHDRKSSNFFPYLLVAIGTTIIFILGFLKLKII